MFSRFLYKTLSIPSLLLHKNPFLHLAAVGSPDAKAVIDFILINPNGPSTLITSPDFSALVVIPKGDTLDLQGQISDDIDLTSVQVVLKEEPGPFTIYSQNLDLPGSTDIGWDFSEMVSQNQLLIIPNTVEAGYYLLQIIAIDSDDNQSTFNFG